MKKISWASLNIWTRPVNYLKVAFGSKSPSRIEVVFVSLKDFVDMSWRSPQPLVYCDADFGMARLQTQGKSASALQLVGKIALRAE